MIDPHEMKVLIVDDMPSVTKFIHRMMKNIGYGKEFFFANSGLEALALLKKVAIDLVLLDYSMPNMSGNEVLHRIREEKRLRDTSVIMITAQAYSDFVAEMGESEVDAYIIKPVTTRVLEEKISAVIDKVNNPSPMHYHLKKARVFEEAGDLDSAILEARLAVEANPHVTRPIRELGYFLYRKNEIEEGKKCFLKAISMNKLDVSAFHYLGQIYLKQKDIEKAAHYLEKAMRISPRHLQRGIDFGKTLVQMNKVPKALQVFTTVLELSKSTPELQEDIIDFCIENKIDEFAVKLLESLIQVRPRRADLLFKLGKILERLGKRSKAIAHLVKASQIDDKNLDIKLHLAEDYLSLKKPMLAEKSLKEVINADPDNKFAKELLKQCI